MRHIIFITSTVLLMSVFSVSFADHHKSILLCAITEVVDCDSLGKCERQTTGQANLPNFITIDLKNNKIVGANVDHNEDITHVEKTEQSFILQGVGEQGRGWTVSLSNNHSVMSGAVVGDKYTFSIFGACRSK
ncbi:MAG: hypothetical protein AAGB35_04540 [Pseudomonadota bacterium]